MNCVLGALLSVPPTMVLPCTADAMIGKFCRLLAPLSASPGSFAVIPSDRRSIPRPPLPKKLLPRMETPVTPSATLIPAPELKAIVLPAPIVPMLMLEADGSTATPL